MLRGRNQAERLPCFFPGARLVPSPASHTPQKRKMATGEKSFEFLIHNCWQAEGDRPATETAKATSNSRDWSAPHRTEAEQFKLDHAIKVPQSNREWCTRCQLQRDETARVQGNKI